MTVAFDGRRAATDAGEAGRLGRLAIKTLAGEYPECSFEIYLPRRKEYPLLKELLAMDNVHARFPKGPWFCIFPFLWDSIGISAMLKRLRPDIYHGLDGRLPGNICKIDGVKTVVSVADLVFLSSPYSYLWYQRHLYNLRIRHACRAADRILVYDRSTATGLVKYYFIQKSRISVAYPGPDPAFSGFAGSSGRPVPVLPDEYVLNDTSADVKRTSAVLAGALENRKDCKVVTVSMSRRRRVPGSLTLQVSSPEDAAYICSRAGAFVCLSSYPGYGSRKHLVDSMALGLPAILAEGPDMEELGGNAAVYVDPEDMGAVRAALSSVLSDSSLRTRMADDSRKMASLHSWKSFATAVMSGYRSLAGR